VGGVLSCCSHRPFSIPVDLSSGVSHISTIVPYVVILTGPGRKYGPFKVAAVASAHSITCYGLCSDFVVK